MKIAIIVVLCLLFATTSFAASFPVSWEPPTTYVDGSALNPADIDHYTVYVGSNPGGPYTTQFAVNGTSFKWVGAAGTYYCVVTVTTRAGIESDYSNEVAKRFPKAPVNLQ